MNLNTRLSQWEAPEGAAPPRGPPPSFIDTEEELFCDGHGSPDHPAACGAKSPHKSHKFRKFVRKWVDKLPGKGGSHSSTSGKQLIFPQPHARVSSVSTTRTFAAW